MIVYLFVAAGLGAGAIVGMRQVLRRSTAIERIDPFTLTDPWRSFVQSAQSAANRFRRIVDGVEEGPLEERLSLIEERVSEGVIACWRIAQSGHDLHKMILEVGSITSDSVARMRDRDTQTRNKLALLVTNLDESVARAAEIAAVQFTGLDAVAGEVDTAVSELESMRQALAEIDRA